jgi:hypothetical protein
VVDNKTGAIEMKTILSLFDYSGNWSKPYREAGYNVIQVDIKLGIDILTFDYQAIPEIYGILCAVPCTDFAVSGARWFAEKDKDGRTELSISLVKKSLEIINYFNPVFWALENPVGRIARLVPELGKTSLIFQPCDYGDAYRKRTCLWGKFNHPIKNPVEPLGIRKGQPDEWYSKMGGKSEKTKAYRSQTPLKFAQAFYEANQ